ncbi:prolyl oligopeptidase family serine peptidase [Aequorivita viscosa]|nr:prolyl oligopeptidase family serine peptidase [Aequorivita viscosa]
MELIKHIKWFVSRKSNSSLVICFFVFLLANWAGPIWGQGPAKKSLQPANFAQWTEFGNLKISPNGKWTSFQLYSQQAPDTLKIRATTNSKKYIFPDSFNGTFNFTGNWFAFNTIERGVALLEPSTANLKYFNNGHHFKFSSDGKFLAIKIKGNIQNYDSGILVYKLHDKDTLFLKNASDFAFNHIGDKLLYSKHNEANFSIHILDLVTLNDSEVRKGNNAFKKLMWSGVEDSFFFVEKDSILHYGTIEPPFSTKQVEIGNKHLKDMKLGFLQPFFSRDGKRVFFYVQKNKLKKTTSDTLPSVQVWKGSDKWVFPRRQYEGTPEDWQLLSYWEPSSGKIEQLGTIQRPQTILTPNHTHVLTYNILDYEPLYQHIPLVDIYLKDIENGKEKLFLKKQQTGKGYVQLSPNGQFISYFNGVDWISYNIKSQTHTNLTKGMGIHFYDVDNDSPAPPDPFGNGGWITNNNGFLVYDAFDIWSISLDGKTRKRLTFGRANKTVFRIYQNLFDTYPYARYPEYKGSTVDLSHDVILSVKLKNTASGYMVMHPNGSMADFELSSSTATSNLLKAKQNKAFVFTVESPEKPTQLWFKKNLKKSAELLSQTNLQYKNYNLGKRELLTYQIDEGKDINAILYYPDNYISGQKYPMITHIYELQSNKMFKFIEPTQYPGNGYDVRSLTSAGYFVLEPDIKYTIGNPGPSALQCVEAVVNTVLKFGMVDKDRVGLIGHSFGGYETAYIIGHTNIFNAAVAGAGIMDFVSFYFSIRWDVGRPNMWHFEKFQERMGEHYFDDIEGYNRNSPLSSAKNINTPLMLWAGSYDRNVHWFQSVEMYLALRRLNKDVTFYLYPGEPHSLRVPQNQLDLKQKVIGWFNNYLK